jgi:hypothetical protein
MKNFNKLVKTLALSTLSLGIATASISEAKAASLVPTAEGEIQLSNDGFSCLDPAKCIDTEALSFSYTVESLIFDEDFDVSRLFADNRGTENTYGFGINSITLEADDRGTNPEAGKNWFRPVAYQGGTAAEEAHLEVGRFRFNLSKMVKELRLDFFDVEDSGVTGVIEVNGETMNLEDLILEGGDNSNIQTLVLNDVKDFVVQLGNVNGSQFPTGDGVDLAVSVPESETTIALSLVAVAGVLTLKRRKTASHKA